MQGACVSAFCSLPLPGSWQTRQSKRMQGGGTAPFLQVSLALACKKWRWPLRQRREPPGSGAGLSRESQSVPRGRLSSQLYNNPVALP